MNRPDYLHLIDPWNDPRSYAPNLYDSLRAIPTGRAGREWSRAVSILRTTIAIASVALCIFCVAYFGLQLLRGAL